MIVHLAAFVANSKIRLLHLVDLDNLGEAGLMILAEAIRKTITLETVILANMYHSIGQDAGNMLKTTLREHPKLNHLDLRGFLGGPYLIDAIVGGLRNGNFIGSALFTNSWLGPCKNASTNTILQALALP